MEIRLNRANIGGAADSVHQLIQLLSTMYLYTNDEILKNKLGFSLICWIEVLILIFYI